MRDINRAGRSYRRQAGKGFSPQVPNMRKAVKGWKGELAGLGRDFLKGLRKGFGK